jgi:hypothetical protein
VRKADNLPPSVSRLSRENVGVSTSHPCGPSWPVTGTALPFFYSILLGTGYLCLSNFVAENISRTLELHSSSFVNLKKVIKFSMNVVKGQCSGLCYLLNSLLKCFQHSRQHSAVNGYCDSTLYLLTFF